MLEPKRIGSLKASIIIPCYNTRNLIRRNLPSVLAAARYKKNQIDEVILIDDASPDDSAQVVEKEFPTIKLIRHRVNRGFSASVNTGARAAKGNLLVLLNTDVIPEKDFLVSALRRFKNPSIFAVSLHEVGYAWARGYFKDGFINHEQGVGDTKLHETFWVSGGSAVYRRDYWMALGGMDEKLLGPFYWEDIDLSYRAAKRGFLNVWDPNAMVTHKHESTISKLSKEYVARIRERNQLLFVWKNITSPILFRKHLIGLFQRVVKHPGYLRIVIMALGRLRILLRARRRETKESRLSDEAIFAKFSL